MTPFRCDRSDRSDRPDRRRRSVHIETKVPGVWDVCSALGGVCLGGLGFGCLGFGGHIDSYKSWVFWGCTRSMWARQLRILRHHTATTTLNQ